MSSEVQEKSAGYNLADLEAVLDEASNNYALLDSLPIWLAAQTTKSAGRGRNADNIRQYGVQKLRELILELAVRGKLVEQDQNDEPASVLLEKIAEEKARLIREGKIKKQKKLPAIHKNEEPYTLPSAWSWVYLGHITNYGITDKAEPNSTNEDCWVLELEDIEKGSSKLLQKVLKSDRQFKSSKNKFSAGDVLYGKLRPYLDKVLVANDDGVCTTEIIPFKGYAKINSAYIRLVMKSPRFMAYANDSTHGMNLPRLGTDNARLALIPLPPIAEQHRIVKKVNELMALCDKLEQQQADAVKAHDTLVRVLLDTLTQSDNAEDFQQNWHRIAEHFDTLFTTESSIDQLKQTLLQLAVMGKLVPQDPNDESASLLVEKIAKEKALLVREGKLKTQKPSSMPSTQLHDLPAGWIWSSFGSITYNRDAERIPLSVDSRKHRQGSFDYYGASGVIDQIDDYLFEKPLLLIGEDGANLINRSTPIAFIARGKYWVNNHAHVIDGISEGFLLYLSLYINSISLIPYITGTAQPKMNQVKMNSIPIAVPPLAEQHRIVKKVYELMALCDQLKDRLNQAQTLQQQIADAVVDSTLKP